MAKKKKRKKKNKQHKIIKALSALIFLGVLVNIAIFCYLEKDRFQSVDADYVTEITTLATYETTTEAVTEETTAFQGITAKPTESVSDITTKQQVTLSETTTGNEETTASVSETATTKKEETASDNNKTERTVIDPYATDWNLVVVNTSREIPEGYVPELSEIYDTGKYLDKRVTPYYEAMYTAAKKDGIILTPYSAYRSYNHQKTNYENLTDTYMTRYGISRNEAAKKAATVILPPGTSEHNLGLAMDICNTLDSFANTKEYKWLTEHAHEYGFILRYTAEKQSITGIVPEPWHWRFVGVEYAKEIKDSGLCLEEWVEYRVKS